MTTGEKALTFLGPVLWPYLLYLQDMLDQGRGQKRLKWKGSYFLLCRDGSRGLALAELAPAQPPYSYLPSRHAPAGDLVSLPIEPRIGPIGSLVSLLSWLSLAIWRATICLWTVPLSLGPGLASLRSSAILSRFLSEDGQGRSIPYSCLISARSGKLAAPHVRDLGGFLSRTGFLSSIEPSGNGTISVCAAI